MPPSLSLFTNGQIINAAHMNERVAEIAAWINYGIDPAQDFAAGRFIETRHLYGLEFYGAPAPRVEGIISDTHYRRVGGESSQRSLHHDNLYAATPSNTIGWGYVKGMAATFKVLKDNTPIDIFASLYGYESGGGGASAESGLCGEYALFVDSSRQEGTLRELYYAVSSGNLDRIAHKNAGIVYTTTLDRGVHSIGIGARVLKDTVGDVWKHINTLNRTFLVEVHHR